MLSRGFFLILCGCWRISNTAPASSDSVLSYSVKLTFSNVSLDSWRLQSKNLVMQETIANLTSDFCRANSEKCGASSGAKTHFRPENVKTVHSYPKNINSNLQTLIFVEIPTNAGSTPDKVPSQTLVTIITNGKSKLDSEIGHDFEDIVLGETLSGSSKKEVDNKLNTIMIPVAFLLLLLVALLCWILHRAKKKKRAREERRRYEALQTSKNCSNSREKGGAMVNTADPMPPAHFSPERRSSPDLEPPENQAAEETRLERNNNSIRRHKKKRALPRNQPMRNALDDESDDVVDDVVREKPKKKGRRLKGRRSYDLNQEYEMQASKELACSQASSVGSDGDSQVNKGYQQDSEKGDSDRARNSNTDSAVDLSSSLASSANQSRPRSLPPIPKTSQQETA